MDEQERPQCRPGQFAELTPAGREDALREIENLMRPLVETFSPEQRRELTALSARLRNGSAAKHARHARGGHHAVR